ncbi:hypothetical protein RhiirA1_455506 [Rhizophagus irregularis]|uniref:Uncharacterized protein n=1 Tax=Rhizophagus irregularis TaxID=588596 RepID=A0A2I1EI95_9GLOM|nr:hypothetical protein RhiirA1_455506 [Rhizophagus irregularis]PKY21850.1 hypothetical protein RhiirB3_435574 [Rhizophagus irregularis]
MISRNLCLLTIPIFICTIFKREATDEGSKTAAGVNGNLESFRLYIIPYNRCSVNAAGGLLPLLEIKRTSVPATSVEEKEVPEDTLYAL